MKNFKLFTDTCWFRFRDNRPKSDYENSAIDRIAYSKEHFFNRIKEMIDSKIRIDDNKEYLELELFACSRKELFGIFDEFSKLNKEEQFKILEWLNRDIGA